MPLADFRITSGKNFSLADFNPDAKPFSSGDKVADQARLTELSTQLDAQQDIFYAEHQRKLLIVLQGMDTSGKDGTVRGVFRSFDPLGIRVVSFKSPPPRNSRTTTCGASMRRCRAPARSWSSTAATTKTC